MMPLGAPLSAGGRPTLHPGRNPKPAAASNRPMSSRTLRSWFAPALLAMGALLAGSAQAAGAVVTTPQVRAELVAHAPEGIAPGRPMWLGLKIDHQPHWHTYWKNPGDSGLPTTLEWTLPAAAAAGDIAWPTPQRLPIGPLMNYGYEGRLLLAVPLTLAAAPAGDSLTVKLAAMWLVCKEVCIPEDGEFTLKLPLNAAIAGHAAEFAAARAALPQPVPGAMGRVTVDGGALRVEVQGLPAAWQGRALQFFPETAGVIQNAALPQARWDGATWRAQVALDPQRAESPAAMPVVLVAEGGGPGLALTLPVSGAWPAAGAAPAPLPALGDAQVLPAEGAGLGLLAAMALALVGGALLNLMPCVFPVLSLKVFGFASHAGERRTLLAGGIAYTVGVVLSFVALAGLLLALRAGGEQLGWGFQLQSPGFVAALAALFTLIGLNLAGLFEFGSVLPSSWAAARARHPLVDSLLTGVLAVAVASPCTAPFMGASLGVAFTLPAAQALAVFAALGLGMALPYLLLAAWPGLARRLPRPGPWMAHFRSLMAFPMFATVVWLVWVLGQQTGIDGVAALLALLLALAFAAWALGHAGLSRRARTGFGGVALLLLAAVSAWALPGLRTLPEGAAAAASAPEAGWTDWSTERVAQARAEGRPVFVDFTAAWCVTCQFNKRSTLADARVKAAFERERVLLLRADWTRRDATIAAELARLGRSGVPVYAFYAPGATAPKLLSEILSVDEVLAAVGGGRNPG